MSGRLQGKVAFISGAARGQGRAHAVRMAEEGADIIAFDAAGPVPSQGAPAASVADLDETVRQVEKLDRRIVAHRADASDLGAVTAVLDQGLAEFGRVDIIVANAGVQGNPAPIAQTSAEEWQAVLATNLTGVFNTVRAAVPHLIEGGRGGSISLVSSSIALRAQPGLGPYGSSKTGVIGLTRSLAVELGRSGVTANAICPGPIRTGMTAQIPEDSKTTFAKRRVPVGRYGEPEEVAHIILSLVLPASSYLNGTVIPVDGGMTANNR